MALRIGDYEAINAMLEQIYDLHDLDSFVETTMQLLPPLVDADMTAFNEVNFRARRMTTVVDSADAQAFYQENQPVFERLMHQNPLIEHHARVRDQPKKISDFMTQKEWRQTDVYREIYSAIDGNYQIAMVLTLESEAIVAFAFNRFHRDFTERHREILTLLQPHITQAYENALRHTETNQQLARRESMLEAVGTGWIDLDPDLAMVRAAPLVPEILSRFFNTRNSSGQRLPQDLEDWVAVQLREAQPDAPPAPLVMQRGNGRLIVRLIGQNEVGEISLIAEHFQMSSSPEALEDLGLTRRQAESLYWASQGKSNVEIAVILKISVRTVENHLYQTLQVLGVSNRTEAAQVAILHLTSQG